MYKSSAFNLIGQAALEGAHVTIPRLLRSVRQTHFGPYVAHDFTISDALQAELTKPVSPTDPTRIFNSYLFDWWNEPTSEYAFETGKELERAFRYHMEMVSGGKNLVIQCRLKRPTQYVPGGMAPLMDPNRHQTSAFSIAEQCSGGACRRILRGALENLKSLQVLVDEMAAKQEQKVNETEKYLDAMETLSAAYAEFNRPLEDREIRHLSERTAGVSLVPSHQPTAPTAGQPAVLMSTETVNLATTVQRTIPSNTGGSKPTRTQKIVNRPGIDSEDCSSDGF